MGVLTGGRGLEIKEFGYEVEPDGRLTEQKHCNDKDISQKSAARWTQ